MKRFLGTSGIFLGVALLLVIATFIYLSLTLPQPVEDQAVNSVDTVQADESTTTDQVVELSGEQKERIEAHGIDAEELVITTDMIRCVQEKIGATRIQELLDGAEPTLWEIGVAGL